MDIIKQVNRLLNYGLQKEFFYQEDMCFTANALLAVLGLDDFALLPIEEELAEPSPILNELSSFAVLKKIIEDTPVARELFETKLMGCLLPRPTEFIARLREKNHENPAAVTQYFYNFCRNADYIKTARLAKNIVWKSATEYGELDITINLSNPEKDPRAIMLARQKPSSGYPKCVLCRENEGFSGDWQRAARQNLRLLPLVLNGKKWYMQYSPYIYKFSW